jgi:hypothetical protein
MHANRGALACQVSQIRRRVRIAGGGEYPLSQPGILAQPLKAAVAYPSH